MSLPWGMKRWHIKAVRNSPPELREIYEWLRNNVFPYRYVLPANRIAFRWYRKSSSTSRCNKKKKMIWISEYHRTNGKKVLYETMLHEMLHLRMPHHRKSFKNKERELKVKLDSII